MIERSSPGSSRTLRAVLDGLYGGLAALPGNPVLSIKSKRCGLLGDVAMTLNGIRFAEQAQRDCRVDWDSRSLYFDGAAGPNPWEYFFRKSRFFFSKSTKRSAFSIPYYPSAFGFMPYDGMTHRQSLAHAIARYCQPRTELNDVVEQYIRDKFRPSTLGVHYRGTDVVTGIEQRLVASLDGLETAITQWLAQHPGGSVFLASDDAAAVERLERRFPEALHYRKCLRSTDGTSLHGHYDKGVPGRGYQKGVEVLIDALLLSRCSLLYHRGSRVSWFAKARNPDLPSVEM
ncbi:MAG TPA: hypothetical protein VM369_07790 [Candidatus Binatia bacterium]|nr:hypothetical protein [Candidatus Binatia bacterium]